MEIVDDKRIWHIMKKSVRRIIGLLKKIRKLTNDNLQQR